MLSKPHYGWSEFQLKNTHTYSLSYLDDIAFEWVNAAIYGLETLSPFCVKGFLEPNRFLCVVSYWNCHIIREGDGRYPLDNDEIVHEYSHTSMIQFCHFLYDDIQNNLDEWVSFLPDEYDNKSHKRKKKALTRKLERLKELIQENEKYWGEHRCFL